MQETRIKKLMGQKGPRSQVHALQGHDDDASGKLTNVMRHILGV
jgi:hypothetical protein